MKGFLARVFRWNRSPIDLELTPERVRQMTAGALTRLLRATADTPPWLPRAQLTVEHATQWSPGLVVMLLQVPSSVQQDWDRCRSFIESVPSAPGLDPQSALALIAWCEAQVAPAATGDVLFGLGLYWRVLTRLAHRDYIPRGRGAHDVARRAADSAGPQLDATRFFYAHPETPLSRACDAVHQGTPMVPMPHGWEENEACVHAVAAAEALCRRGTAADLVLGCTYLLTTDPAHGLSVIAGLSPDRRRTLSPTLLLSVLAHGDGAIRAQALMLANRLGIVTPS